jgi:hypothetical protein
MARKNRSLRKGTPKPVDIDVVGLYDELVPSWRLGSPDTMVAVRSPAVFSGRKHHPGARIHGSRHDLTLTA